MKKLVIGIILIVLIIVGWYLVSPLFISVELDEANPIVIDALDSMTSEDFLIMGVELTNIAKISKILPGYKGKMSEDFVYFTPEKIRIKRKDTKYDVSWNDKAQQVEVRMILKKDILVKIGSEKFKLERDEQILLGRSVKFTEWNITKLLSEVGFRTELLTTAEDRGYLRSQYLDKVCAGNEDLRQKIEELLRAASAAGDFLE